MISSQMLMLLLVMKNSFALAASSVQNIQEQMNINNEISKHKSGKIVKSVNYMKQ